MGRINDFTYQCDLCNNYYELKKDNPLKSLEGLTKELTRLGAKLICVDCLKTLKENDRDLIKIFK